jgi:hypothetical protein
MQVFLLIGRLLHPQLFEAREISGASIARPRSELQIALVVPPENLEMAERMWLILRS